MELTVGELLDCIENGNFKRKDKVKIQRIEDKYFGKDGWDTVKITNGLGDDLPKDEYVQSTRCGKYNSKKDNYLYIDAHY